MGSRCERAPRPVRGHYVAVSPGTGKSHVAKAVAYQATLQGHDVRYVEADTEFASFALASPQEQSALMRTYIEPDLLVLDSC